MKKRVLILLAGLLVVTAAPLPVLAEGGSLLIKNGTVLTVTRGVITGGDVLIVDGIIAAVGRDIPPPAGT